MKKIKYLLLFLIFLLAGCQTSTLETTLTGDPLDVNKEQIYYNPIEKKLVKFNPNGNTHEIINDDPSSFAYDINNADNYFIVGDSINHKFKLIEITKDGIETTFEFESNEELIPLGYNADDIYFVHSFYKNGVEEKEKRTISLINLSTNNVSDIESVKGLISNGVVSPENIYYTVFNNENNYHELYKKSIELGKKSDPPELISVGYETDELYLSKDLLDEKEYISLYATDKDRIYSKEESWPKFEENYFRPTTMIGIEKSDNGLMEITFIDKRTREISNEVRNVVGIRFEGDTIVIATTSGASKY